MIINILLIAFGLSLLILGAEILIRGASNIAKRFHIPEILIGLTIVAIGTSLPELIITIESSLRGANDLIVGNSIGSDLCNLLLILGTMAIIKPIKINSETRRYHIPIALISTLIITLIGICYGSINFKTGILFIIFFIVYIIYPIILDRKKIIAAYKNDAQIDGKEKRLFIQIISIAIGIVFLKLGGDFIVDNATAIAKIYGVSERIIGLTIIAIGTALPELVTSIVATINNDADIGIGNLIGSSVLNSFLIFGVGAIIDPIIISNEFIMNLIFLSVSSFLILIFCYIPKKNTITRKKGLILVILFIIYMVMLFL